MELGIIVALSVLCCAINWVYARILSKRKKCVYVYISLTSLWMKIWIILCDILFVAMFISPKFYTYLSYDLWVGIKSFLFITLAMATINWLIACYYIPKGRGRIKIMPTTP